MTVRILLVDDHAVVRDGLRYILEAQAEFSIVAEASNGHSAIQLAQSHCPDVAIIDIVLPELNGIEAAQQISQACAETRIIILSMYATPEYIYRAVQAGARGYLIKESAGEEVVAAVRAVVEGRRYLSHQITEAMLDDYIELRQAQQIENPLESLTLREREVLQLIVEGYSAPEIGAKLALSSRSIDTYRSRIMAKLGINNLPDLVKFAIRHGLTSV